MLKKRKKIDSLHFQLLLIDLAISRFSSKVSERINLEDPFMIKYMNESESFKNLMWRKSTIEIDLFNLQ